MKRRNLNETEKVISKAFKECSEFMVRLPGEKIRFSSEDDSVTLQGNPNKTCFQDKSISLLHICNLCCQRKLRSNTILFVLCEGFMAV